MSINRFLTPADVWAILQTIVSKFLLVVTSNPVVQLLVKYVRLFDVFGDLYVDIQWNQVRFWVSVSALGGLST